jgi:hypothetical protein
MWIYHKNPLQYYKVNNVKRCRDEGGIPANKSEAAIGAPTEMIPRNAGAVVLVIDRESIMPTRSVWLYSGVNALLPLLAM